ncbi:MAG: DUF305 domain-containing protein [Pyrinomonadaceae bacterium]
MKKNICAGVILLLAVGGFGCGSQSPMTNANSNMAMNHNANMPMNSNNMQGMDHGNMDHSMMQSAPNAASAPYDLQFLDTMIAHHRGAVDMAGPCGAKAHHAEVKTLCANIISSQQKEIADMKAWRDKWFAGAAAAMNMEMPGMNDSMKGMDMKMLGTLSGNEFDLAFVKQMIPHHEGAVIMAKEALQKSTKDEIKTLAGAIIKAQEAEIKQMKDWQTAWSK